MVQKLVGSLLWVSDHKLSGFHHPSKTVNHVLCLSLQAVTSKRLAAKTGSTYSAQACQTRFYKTSHVGSAWGLWAFPCLPTGRQGSYFQAFYCGAKTCWDPAPGVSCAICDSLGPGQTWQQPSPWMDMAFGDTGEGDPAEERGLERGSEQCLQQGEAGRWVEGVTLKRSFGRAMWSPVPLPPPPPPQAGGGRLTAAANAPG